VPLVHKAPTRGDVSKRLSVAEPSFVRHPSLAGVEIRVVRDRGAHSAPTPPMITSDLKLAMVLRGANRFLYRGSSWIVPGGTLILAEPGELHAVESVDGAFDVLILFADLATVSGLRRGDASAFKDGVSFRGPLTRDGTCVRAFRSLASTLADTSTASLLVEERMLSVMEAVSSAYAGRIPPADRTVDASAVRRAREMLHDLYLESVTLDALAAESGLPKPRFLRAFRRVVGISPHAYQVHLRVDLARRMLAAGAAVADAASAAGFFDQSHFHRHFRRLHGVTPARYRNLPTLGRMLASGTRARATGPV
jgi:AraC-like DNA-binding protein